MQFKIKVEWITQQSQKIYNKKKKKPTTTNQPIRIVKTS